ncbi:tRNA (N(6)-L-threonylcarbamoyladenosine(37)-C(2))-methylthiotransferase [Candidatus Korarchaeum cryptofilum]|uniref:tRNA-t(6)A37 methylthiotransferase n=1 Tax=Korarchaeum cryptofilum (strain OPF8) TaxID=374847 RepID=B1L7I6_KORCO|nr:tRNA (N(6)-L-threonylcarbamoyladenosine(37)-C(2))-methylthiotransferase [Candidatus Korarchaeum cryptofilum]ACB06813.1 2-methylthioadenine synthetase [Candidatus Korarchaeum cryptofilum OPF8]
MRFYIETYGCSMNRSDSQIMEKLLEEAGLIRVNDPREADVIVLNTCNVKTPTEQRMIQRARELSKYAPLVVAGCMAKSQGYKLKDFSKVLVAPREIDKIVEAVNSAIAGRRAEFLEWRFIDKSSYLRDPLELVGIIPIAEGCMGACTYCITRLARGGLTSFPKRNILRLAEHFLRKGAVELWLTSEDTAAYGRDMGENLANLIMDLSDLPGDFRIRVGMMTPSSALPILSELIGAYRSRKVYKFFHLPVQSGSDRVLEDMGRNYTVDQFLSMVDFIRKELSDVSIATDIIVGFPTEDEEDFESTLAILERLKPDVVNVSKFGARPGTKAASMRKLPDAIVSRRSKEVNELVERIKEEVNERYLGRELEVLVSEKGEKGFQGRTNSYKPVALREVKLGHFYLVEIVDFRANYLIGEVKEELGKAGLQIELKLT